MDKEEQNMKNNQYAFLIISAILGLVTGILACLTLLGIVIGIPLIIGATKYFEWAKLSNDELAKQQNELMIWGVVFTILMFPIGAIALFPPLMMSQNNFNKTEETSKKEFQQTNATSSKKTKLERITELSELKEKGLIDETDFEIAKKKILSED